MTQQPIFMQIVLTLIAALGLERIFNRLRARQMGVGIVALWIIGTIIFLIFVWRPDLSTKFSGLIGIGRGVDAAVYVAVAVLFYTTLRIFLRLERQEHLITQLVSEIALLRHKHSEEERKR